jgi:hypothetical protein
MATTLSIKRKIKEGGDGGKSVRKHLRLVRWLGFLGSARGE